MSNFERIFRRAAAAIRPSDAISTVQPGVEATSLHSGVEQIDCLINILATGDETAIRAAANKLRTTAPFLYAALSDTLSAAAQDAAAKRDHDYAEVIRARAEALHHWDIQTNRTILAIVDGRLDPDEIRPHIRFPSATYDAEYASQSEQAGKRHKGPPSAVAERDFVPLAFGRNVNHAFRGSHAVALVETAFALIAATKGQSYPTIRWMDIGCGRGEIANGVNPTQYASVKWEIVGCDFQEGRIEVANRRRSKGRTFIVGDAFDVLRDCGERAISFDLVTMFEFLEHLEDPLKLLDELRAFNPEFVLAGSPLEQTFRSPRNAQPDRVHLWSFSRKAWERMFALAGFDVVFSSEARVGSYIGGLDWLNIMCGPRDYLREHRQDLRVPPP
ncbi:MAG TPA: class I SAM-dependent methyltransferase [Rhizomicrobium sp.]|jgi:2-polyprenyl-3-methyl-5-hydroxy-6-metoxy-1,4-benzoquinol methylase